MPFATPPEPPVPWKAFLLDLDRALSRPVELHCAGGFVVAVCHGFARVTADVDYVEIVPSDALGVLQELAGPGSMLAKKHGLYVQHVAVASLPESYAERAVGLFPDYFDHLRLFALEAHDLALSKLGRNSPVDREDVRFLAKTVPLDAALFRARYERELRPIAIGNLQALDETIDMWIEAFFPRT